MKESTRYLSSSRFYIYTVLCAGAGADPVVRIENLPCSRNQTFCEANVLLARNLELGRVYDLRLRLRDTRGDTTTVSSTIRPTNSSTPIDTIFPHLPLLVIVPEVGSKGKALQTILFNTILLQEHQQLEDAPWGVLCILVIRWRYIRWEGKMFSVPEDMFSMLVLIK